MRQFEPLRTRRGYRALLLACGAGSLLLAGCSGSSSSGTVATTTTGSGRATVLLTDSVREEFAHVWATIYHVELTPQGGGTPVVVFDDSSGKQIDLKTLRDSTGQRYAFLSSASIPQGVYTAVSVTVGPTFQLFKNGTAVGDPLTVDTSLPKDSSGNPIITLTFKTAKTLGTGTTNLVIDFDLARFIVRDSKIIPVLQEGDTTGLGDPHRHNKEGYRGAVSRLSGTSPTLTFTLTQPDGTTVSVSTSSSTAFYGGTLANGSAVDIRGTLDTTTQVLTATEVEVHGANATAPTPHIYGAASALSADAGTFTLTPTAAGCFTPTQTTVNVVTTSSTVYRDTTGATETEAAFFTAAASAANVLVEGSYDAASNTLTATLVKNVAASTTGN